MSANDTAAVSVVHDHPFIPRLVADEADMRNGVMVLRPTPYLCARCRLAEAAHTTTTAPKS